MWTNALKKARLTVDDCCQLCWCLPLACAEVINRSWELTVAVAKGIKYWCLSPFCMDSRTISKNWYTFNRLSKTPNTTHCKYINGLELSKLPTKNSKQVSSKNAPLFCFLWVTLDLRSIEQYCRIWCTILRFLCLLRRAGGEWAFCGFGCCWRDVDALVVNVVFLSACC